MIAAIITFCSIGALTSCNDANADNDSDKLPQVKNTELVRTSQSWDGVELPDYPEGCPELVALNHELPARPPLARPPPHAPRAALHSKHEFPAGQKLGWHHPSMDVGILV